MTGNPASRTRVKVCDLEPGAVVANGGMFAAFISKMPHPYYVGLQLVVWRMEDGRVMLDALDLGQDVGVLHQAGNRERLYDAIAGTWKL